MLVQSVKAYIRGGSARKGNLTFNPKITEDKHLFSMALNFLLPLKSL